MNNVSETANLYRLTQFAMFNCFCCASHFSPLAFPVGAQDSCAPCPQDRQFSALQSIFDFLFSIAPLN